MISDASLWEVFLEECDPNTIPEYKMKVKEFRNLDEIIQLSQRKSIPTVRFILDTDYLNNLEEKRLWLDKRPLNQYYALVVSGGGYYPPLNVKYTKPSEMGWGNNVHSIVSSLKSEGKNKAIVVGGYAEDCVIKTIKEYLAEKLEVIVPKDALQGSEKKHDSTIKNMEKIGVNVLSKKSLIKALNC